jgi:hypothetical protein
MIFERAFSPFSQATYAPNQPSRDFLMVKPADASATEPPVPRRSMRRRLLLIGLWSAVGLWMLMLAKALPARATRWDYTIYYTSALAMRQGMNAYTQDLTPLARSLGFDLGKINHATDPPTFVLCFEPLTLFSPHIGFWIWTGINALAFLLALVLLLRWTPALNGDNAWVVAGIVLLFPPVVDHLVWGQNKMLLLLMLVLMMRWMEQGKDAAAGLILALGSLLRAFPLLLVAYLVLLGRWRVVWYTMVGLAVGGVATLALLGVGRSFSFLFALDLLTQSRWQSLPGNIALGPTIWRACWYLLGDDLTPATRLLAHAISLAAEAAVLGFTLKATLHRRNDADRDWRLLSLWIMTAILLSPTSWFYYLVLLAIPMVEMSAAVLAGTLSKRALYSGCAVFLLAWPYYVIIDAHPGNFGWFEGSVIWRLGAAPVALLAYLSLYWFAVDQPVSAAARAEPTPTLEELQVQAANS